MMGLTIPVVFRDRLDEYGLVHHVEAADTYEIWIRDDMPKDLARRVAFHELCHLFLILSGYSDQMKCLPVSEEGLVESMERHLLPAWDELSDVLDRSKATRYYSD